MTFNIMGGFNNFNEQNLISDLIEEAIDQRGSPVRYILRDQLNPDYMLGESTMSDFKEFYELPMFVESVEHFNGNGDVFDAFGMNYVDQSIFQVSERKFNTVVAEPSNIERPREGDLIYLPFSDSLWEITKVKRDLKYHQVGRNHTFRLVCHLFTFSHEKIDASSTQSDFNALSDETLLDSSGMKRLLGIDDLSINEDDVIEQDISPSTVPVNNLDFGF